MSEGGRMSSSPLGNGEDEAGESLVGETDYHRVV